MRYDVGRRGMKVYELGTKLGGFRETRGEVIGVGVVDEMKNV